MMDTIFVSLYRSKVFCGEIAPRRYITWNCRICWTFQSTTDVSKAHSRLPKSIYQNQDDL